MTWLRSMFNIVLQPRLLFMHNKINECTVVHNMCLTHTSSRTNKHSFIVTHDTFKELCFATIRHVAPLFQARKQTQRRLSADQKLDINLALS